jgi:anti-sigma-K factor RskA
VSPRDHSRWEDELAAWALGALEPGEAQQFERHLARCERCRTDLRWLRPAIDTLPASVTQVTPPPRLRGRLLGIVRTEARRAAAPDRPGRWLARLAVPRPAMAALGAAALVAAGIGGYALRGGSDSSTLQVQASREAPGASAELVVEGDTGTLRASGMPTLGRNEVFQAWVREQGQADARPSTVFVPGQGGSAAATIPGIESADEVLVTQEPRGGSTHPTTKPLLRAKLS